MTFPVSNFLLSVTKRHYSNDAKEVDNLDLCGLSLNWYQTLGVLHFYVWKNIRCYFIYYEL